MNQQLRHDHPYRIHSHDSRIRSDLAPIGISRKTAQKFADDLNAYFDDETTMAHLGRRDGRTDRASATSPGGWFAGHAGASTVKIRGCTQYRLAARNRLRHLVLSAGIEWGRI